MTKFDGPRLYETCFPLLAFLSNSARIQQPTPAECVPLGGRQQRVGTSVATPVTLDDLCDTNAATG